MIQMIISLGCSAFCCLFSIAVIGGAVYFFVFRKKDEEDLEDAGDALSGAASSAPSTPSTPAADVGEDDATVVASAPEGAPSARPPRTSGATIIAFDDDEL